MIVDGSSGGRPRGRQTKVNRETPIIFEFCVLTRGYFEENPSFEEAVL